MAAEASRVVEPLPLSGDVELSVVMPCLNEARTVGPCVRTALEALTGLGVRGEVVVADNGSSDGSADIARAAGARVVLVTARGYGAALQGGIAAARGRYVVIGDADASYDFGRLEGFLSRLRSGDDLVMGNRFAGGIRPGAMPWHHRYLGNPVLTFILNLLYRAGVGDAHCGLRAVRKDAYDRLGLVTPGMEFASEMVVKATLAGLRVGEVPVVLHPDGRDRPPHLRSFRDGWRHLRFLLLFSPASLFLVPAFVLLALGLGMVARFSAVTELPSANGWAVYLAANGLLVALLGYQAAWLGLAAKALGVRLGLFPADRVSRTAASVTVEIGLAAGCGLALAGVGWNLWLVRHHWGSEVGSGWVTLTVREALWGIASVALGIQTACNSLFLDLLKLWLPEQATSRLRERTSGAAGSIPAAARRPEALDPLSAVPEDRAVEGRDLDRNLGSHFGHQAVRAEPVDREILQHSGAPGLPVEVELDASRRENGDVSVGGPIGALDFPDQVGRTPVPVAE